MRIVPRERCFTYYSLRWAALQGYDDSLAPRSEPLGPQGRDSEGRRARRRHNFARSVCCDRPPRSHTMERRGGLKCGECIDSKWMRRSERSRDGYIS